MFDDNKELKKQSRKDYPCLDYNDEGYAIGKILKNTCLLLEDDNNLSACDKKTILAKGTGESVRIEKFDSDELNIRGEIGKNNHFICKAGMVTIDATAIGDNFCVELYGKANVIVETKGENMGQNVKFIYNSEENKVDFMDKKIDEKKFVVPYASDQKPPSSATSGGDFSNFSHFFPTPTADTCSEGVIVNQIGKVGNVQIGNTYTGCNFSTDSCPSSDSDLEENSPRSNKP